MNNKLDMDDTGKTPIRVELADEAATAALAARVSARARPGDVFALSGPLGSGKTVFARAFINARTRTPQEVPGPTFTLVQGYEFPNAEGAIPVYHFDLFRIENADETAELGMDDAFAGGISLIEWPDRLGAYLPPRRLMITMEFGGHESARRLDMEAPAPWASRIRGLKAGV